MLFLEDSKDVWEKLKQKDVILIVPADEGQTIKDYVDSSELKGKIECYDNGTSKGITVLNPAEAKGLEFPNIAIYGFGEYPKELLPMQIAEWFEHKDTPNGEQDIEAKYFLNNAYVAATRAKEHLYIVGNSEKETIWWMSMSDKSYQQDIEDKMLESLSPKIKVEWRTDNLGVIVSGSAEDITDDNSIDWEEITADIEKQADVLQDYTSMLKAANRYKERGNEKDGHRCRAKAETFAKNFIKAAEEFSLAEMYNESAEYYWLAIDSQNSVEILKELAKLAHLTSNHKGAIIAAKALKAKELEEINKCLYDLADNMAEMSISEKQIRGHIANYLLKKVSSTTVADSDKLPVIVKLVLSFFDAGLQPNIGGVVQLLFANKKYDDVIKLGERLNNRPKEYYKAKIQTTVYPERTYYYRSAGYEDWQERTYDDYRNHSTEKIEQEEALRHVAECIVACSNDKGEVRKYAAIILSRQTNDSNLAGILSKLQSMGVAINKADIELVDAIRLTYFIHRTEHHS